AVLKGAGHDRKEAFELRGVRFLQLDDEHGFTLGHAVSTPCPCNIEKGSIQELTRRCVELRGDRCGAHGIVERSERRNECPRERRNFRELNLEGREDRKRSFASDEKVNNI